MIEINNTTKREIDEQFLKKIAQQVLKAEKSGESDLSVAVVGVKKSQELNKIYRGKDRAANVLSFPEKEFGLGEIVLCPQEIEKDAKKYGILFQQVLALMLIHGILHLLGYSHSAMAKKEKHYEVLYRNRS
ncbi:rRNA maturation RNase YbeY [Patescibacteria group bacterium]|nr:rRNA maturation RNase YbeY [Patescibacteria group bacterium]